MTGAVLLEGMQAACLRQRTADGVGANEIMRRTAKSKTCVWRWQERFLEDGFDGLVRDKTRPSRIKPLSADCDAWNKLIDQPWRIMSIGLRQWAYAL